MTKSRIVSITRTWIDTPYHHQESKKGIGCDCLGLLRGVWREYYGTELPEKIPNYSPSWNDHMTENNMLLRAQNNFKAINAPKEGDLILFRMTKRGVVKHCSIMVSDNTMIHAYTNHKVREELFTDWWKKKVAGYFEFIGA